MMKKVFIMAGSMKSGGAERCISELTKALAGSYAITIVLYYSDVLFYEIDHRVRIVELEKISSSTNIAKNSVYLRYLVKKEKPDVFVSFLVPFNVFSFYSLLGVKVPKILCERNDPRCWTHNPIMLLLRNIAYRYCDRVVVQTRMELEYFGREIRKHSEIINNPCFLNGKLIGSAINAEKHNKIVCVCRLNPQKNISMLLRAFSVVSKEFPSYCLKIYGEGEVDYKDKIQQEIWSLGLEGRVFLMGVKKNIYEELSDARFFVMTSLFEGMSNAVMEAISLGLPVICTSVSGSVEMIENGKNGYIISQGDEATLVEKMRYLMSSPELCSCMGYNSVEVSKRFEIGIILEQWRQCLERAS